MEFTGKEIKTDTSLTISLLKMFSMFSVIFKVVEGTVNEVTLKCMNCKRVEVEFMVVIHCMTKSVLSDNSAPIRILTKSGIFSNALR